MASKQIVTLIPGDGIGPEVTEATRRIIEAAGAPIEWDIQHAGATIFKKGIQSGVPEETIQSITRNKVALKGPLETPVGYGEKSANVTLRKLFETYGNIRPVKEMPGVVTPYSGRGIDLVVVRENVEDLYAGIEHMQTPGVAQCLKIMSRKGCEKVVRLAFAVARAEGRTKVHCATKANIMKMSEGLLKATFEEIAQEFPDIDARHIIVDNCAHQLVREPEQFQVIVTSNMNGDILSDLTSGLIGGLGFAPGANIGSDVSIFEAVHGSAPKYAGLNKVNPTAVLLSGVMMLRHIGMFEQATLIENSVLYTLEEGKTITYDARPGQPSVGTKEYADGVIANLGKAPVTAKAARTYKPLEAPDFSKTDFNKLSNEAERKLLGIDLFVESQADPNTLGSSLTQLAEGSAFKLKMISNRGTQVFPNNGAITDTVDHYRCRFILKSAVADGPGPSAAADVAVLDLVQRVAAKHRWNHIEKLGEVNGKPSYTKAQGED